MVPAPQRGAIPVNLMPMVFVGLSRPYRPPDFCAPLTQPGEPLALRGRPDGFSPPWVIWLRILRPTRPPQAQRAAIPQPRPPAWVRPPVMFAPQRGATPVSPLPMTLIGLSRPSPRMDRHFPRPGWETQYNKRIRISPKTGQNRFFHLPRPRPCRYLLNHWKTIGCNPKPPSPGGFAR
jgi:hypothetical protein